LPHQRIDIATGDGNCPVHLFTPDRQGRFPAIVFFMDAGGIRPTVLAMADRLASAGYVVLLPDLFYRFGPYGPIDVPEVLAGGFMEVLGPMMASTSNAKAAQDTGSFLKCLDARGEVRPGSFGAVGFCMGGGMAIAAAGIWPDRFAAVASFHGGNLATDASDSPHRYVPSLRAELYLAVAEGDDSYPPAMAERFEGALRTAQVSYSSEAYPATHGWMKPDFPVYDPDAAEHGWREMLAFFGRTLHHHG
jgi:carboxymethylenebutenolidase